MATQILTAERLRELLHYDPETGMFTRKIGRGGKAKAGSVAGTTNTSGHIQVMVDGKLYLAHRLVWMYVHGQMPSEQLDHINRTPTDNRIENLRPCNHAKNMQNKGAYKNNSSGCVGVYKTRAGNWMAAIGVEGKFKSLGTYKTFEEAVATRKAAQKEVHTFSGPRAYT